MGRDHEPSWHSGQFWQDRHIYPPDSWILPRDSAIIGQNNNTGRQMRYRAGAIALGIGLAVTAAALPLQAQDQSDPFDFTFKRIKVASKPVLIQIDPEEQARLLARRPKSAEHPEALPAPGPLDPAKRVASNYAWFWETVPTTRGATDGRFPLALATLSKGPGGAQVYAPRMQHMQQIAEVYGTEILTATIGTQVSPALVLAVIGIESAGKADAISSAGAQGLMQLIPATAERFGVKDSKDPAQNIKGGVAYLDWLMTHFDRDPLMVLAAYNAGEGAVRANDGVPPYAETRDYVPKVLAAWQVAQGLCRTPPELVTDPCVFRVISAGG